MAQLNLTPAGPDASGVTAGALAGPDLVSRLQQSDLFRDYQKAFEATTGLPLILRAAGSFRTPLQGSKRVNLFCTLMTQSNRTCAACLQLQQRVEREAMRKPKTRRCFAGLSETAVPVRVGDTVVGYLQTGQVFFRTPSKKSYSEFVRVRYGGEVGVDSTGLESAYFQTRIVIRRKYEAVIRLLAIFAEHLATVSNQILIQATKLDSPMIVKVRAFIAEHQGEELSLGAAARAGNMSVFYFCKVFKRATGLGFTEYLARARIESVKQMLLDVHLRVGDAGYAAGFQSLSQFNRVFRRVVGETPSRYRERLHGVVRKCARNAILVRAA